MTGPGVTINAAVLAAAVRINAVGVRHIGAVVGGKNGFRRVVQEYRSGRWHLLRIEFRQIDIQRLEMIPFETVWRIKSRSVPAGHVRWTTKFVKFKEPA